MKLTAEERRRIYEEEKARLEIRDQLQPITDSPRVIAERGQAGTAFQASEEQCRNILESITDAFFALDQGWHFIYVNSQAERILERAPGTLLGKVLWEEYPGLIGSEFEKVYLKAAHEGLASSLTAFYPDHDRWYEVRVYPASEGITIYFQDVSERKQAEATLLQSEAKYRLLLNSVDQGFCHCEIIVDTTGKPVDYRFLEVNSMFEQMTGLVNSSGRTALELVPHLEVGWIETYGRVALMGESIRFQQGSEAMGRYFDVFSSSVGGGRFVILFTDISERKQAEEALKRSETQFRRLLETNMLGVIIAKVSGQISDANEAFLSMLGYTRDDLLAGELHWQRLTPDNYHSRTHQTIKELQEEGICTPYQKEYFHKDGHRVPVYIGAATLDEQGETLIAYVLDLTEQKQHERDIEALNYRLRRSMTETHHRVKNNLQVISAMIEMQGLNYQGEQTIPLDAFLQLKSHIHTLSIIHDLLTQTVKESEDVQYVSAQAVLERLLPLLQQTAWEQTLQYHIDDAALTSKQCIALSLILNELVSNALKHGDTEAEITFHVQDTQAILSISDDGAGFPDGFDPVQSANTGLELVMSLVRSDLSGAIHFATRPQGGGQVTVTFTLI